MMTDTEQLTDDDLQKMTHRDGDRYRMIEEMRQLIKRQNSGVILKPMAYLTLEKWYGYLYD